MIPHDALQELGVFSPDLIVVAADTGGVWSEMSDRVLRTLFRGKRIVGLGSGGTDLFQELGATIGTGSGSTSPVATTWCWPISRRATWPRPTYRQNSRFVR